LSLFSLERFEQIHPLFQGGELSRIEAELFGVLPERPRYLGELDDRQREHLPNCLVGVNFFQVAEEPLSLRELRQDGIVGFREPRNRSG
jgi:hypothetical protein